MEPLLKPPAEETRQPDSSFNPARPEEPGGGPGRPRRRIRPRKRPARPEGTAATATLDPWTAGALDWLAGGCTAEAWTALTARRGEPGAPPGWTPRPWAWTT